jgi:hypothetical protein
MKLVLYTEVVLTCDVPENGLKRGDIVKISLQRCRRYRCRHCRPATALEPLRDDEILCAQSLIG